MREKKAKEKIIQIVVRADGILSVLTNKGRIFYEYGSMWRKQELPDFENDK